MESSLIRRAAHGDSQAFEALMQPMEGRVYALCLRMMGNAHDGEDCAQEAVLRIWQKLGGFRGDAAFATWVYRVTASVCTDAIRKRSRSSHPSLEALGESGFDPADSAPTPEEAAQADDTRARMRLAIDQVPEGMRSVFLLRDVHGLSVAQTAQALRLSEGTVKSRLARARERIAASMRAQMEDDASAREKGGA